MPQPVLLILLLVAVASPQRIALAEEAEYESLQAYCVATSQDTPENCACGQATADEIMSSQEQALALELMTGNSAVLAELGPAQQQEFYNKLAQVTSGCS